MRNSAARATVFIVIAVENNHVHVQESFVIIVLDRLVDAVGIFIGRNIAADQRLSKEPSTKIFGMV